MLMGSNIENLRFLDKAFTHPTFSLKLGLIFLNKLIDELTIFLQGQLTVIIYFNDYGLFCLSYLTLHVKLPHEWMLYDL